MLKQKLILTCASKRVKVASRKEKAKRVSDSPSDDQQCNRRNAALPESAACWLQATSGTVFMEAPMQAPVVCVQCDKPEGSCNCEKYCTICKGMINVKLCADGLYYCPDCREACDVSLASSHSER
jgi:hypothetical protein